MPISKVRFHAWYEKNKFVKYVFAPFAMSAPPALLGIGKHWDWLQSQFDKAGWLVAVCLIWPILAIIANGIFQASKPRLLGPKQLMWMLNGIDQIIGAKIERFSAAAKRILDDKNLKDEEIFRLITQPDTQIEKTVTAVWHYVRHHVDDPETLTYVVLARMGKEHIQDFEVTLPPGQGPTCPLRELQVEQSGFSRTLKKGKILIIEDVEKEGRTMSPKRSFVITTGDENCNKGSMICFPIKVTGFGVPFVLSILVSEPGYFKATQAKGWELILGTFGKRIELEYGLKVLKERTRGGEKQPAEFR